MDRLTKIEMVAQKIRDPHGLNIAPVNRQTGHWHTAEWIVDQLQSLSQEAVRDEAFDEAANELERAFAEADTLNLLHGAARVRALKREPSAAGQAQVAETGDSSVRGPMPAPAAPDVAEMVKRAIKEMRFFQSVRSRVPADAQYDEWIALLARLGQRIETHKESEHPSNYEFPPVPGASR